MARSAQGSTFSYAGIVFNAISVSVEAPTPEIVDMTPPSAPLGVKVLVPTGDATSTGRIEVEAIPAALVDPKILVGTLAPVEFATPAGSITRNVICDSANITGQVGDFFRLRMTFVPTDFQ